MTPCLIESSHLYMSLDFNRQSTVHTTDAGVLASFFFFYLVQCDLAACLFQWVA